MKFTKFLQDNLFALIIFIISLGIIVLLFLAFKISLDLIFATLFVLLFGFILTFAISFLRKRKFYTDLKRHIAALDQAYLVLETLKRPHFYEGELLTDALYEIDKSMKENVNTILQQSKDFQEYLEMWVHEVKAPLASLTLMSSCPDQQFDRAAKAELACLENYVEQVLYYARSENAEKDYLIQPTNLTTIVKNVGLKNLPTLQNSHLDFIVENVDFTVLTDAKWLEFILGQIIQNSIKYHRAIKHPYIKISAHSNHDRIVLDILDNGIGIPRSELKQVFDKSFTGTNGRKIVHSTGMGLFIAKKLCSELGHQITITSTENKFTKVSLVFAKNDFFKVAK